MNLLKISVIIPTYNSMLLLKSTLDSFKNQKLNRDSFEIIIVDDGSNDGSRYLVDEYRRIFDISYYYLEDKGFRLAAARNIGIHFAKYPITLVFDCGMLASPLLLLEHIKVHHEYDDAVVLGLSYGVEEFSMLNAEAINNILDENTLVDVFRLFRENGLYNDCRYKTIENINFDLTKMRTPWVVCWGGNLSCRTQTFRELNGFDEWFNAWGGEDVELGIRLFNRGCVFQALRTMEAIHAPHYRNAEENMRSSKENIKYIISKHKHPDVRLLQDFGWEGILANLDHEEELLGGSVESRIQPAPEIRVAG